MSTRVTVAVIAVALLAGAAGFYVSRTMAPAPAAKPKPDTAAVGQPLPAFELPDLDGATVSAESLTGKPLLINFWATWCAPCRREMPALMAVHDALGGDGAVIGIALDEPEAVSAYVSEMSIDYPILVAGDLEGTRLVQRYGNANGLLPYSVFVDAAGNVTHLELGEITHEEALERMQALVAPPE